MDSTILLLYYDYKCVPAGFLHNIYIHDLYFLSSNLENWEPKADQSRIEGRNPGWDLRVSKMLSFCKNHLDFEHLTLVNSFDSFDCTNMFDYSYIFDIVEDVSLLFKHLSIAYREGFFCYACSSFCCRTCRWRSRRGHGGNQKAGWERHWR